MAKESFALLYEEFPFSDQQVKHVENQIKAISEQSSVCKKSDEIQGIGELDIAQPMTLRANKSITTAR